MCKQSMTIPAIILIPACTPGTVLRKNSRQTPKRAQGCYQERRPSQSILPMKSVSGPGMDDSRWSSNGETQSSRCLDDSRWSSNGDIRASTCLPSMPQRRWEWPWTETMDIRIFYRSCVDAPCLVGKLCYFIFRIDIYSKLIIDSTSYIHVRLLQHILEHPSIHPVIRYIHQTHPPAIEGRFVCSLLQRFIRDRAESVTG